MSDTNEQTQGGALPSVPLQPVVGRGYRVANAHTAEGLQAIVNNLLLAGFEPIGGISVVKTGVYRDSNNVEIPVMNYAQALFYTPNPGIDARQASQPTTEAR